MGKPIEYKIEVKGIDELKDSLSRLKKILEEVDALVEKINSIKIKTEITRCKDAQQVAETGGVVGEIRKRYDKPTAAFLLAAADKYASMVCECPGQPKRFLEERDNWLRDFLKNQA